MISGEFSYRSAGPSLLNKVLETSQITALFFDQEQEVTSLPFQGDKN